MNALHVLHEVMMGRSVLQADAARAHDAVVELQIQAARALAWLINTPHPPDRRTARDELVVKLTAALAACREPMP